MTSEDGTRIQAPVENDALGGRDAIDLRRLRAAGRGTPVVVLKRRRVAVPAGEAGGAAAGAAKGVDAAAHKPGRVYQLPTAVHDVPGAEPPPEPAFDLPDTAPVRRGRARRNPLRAPSAVKRIVFEPPPQPELDDVVVAAGGGVDLLAECALDPLYDDVQCGLRVLRADLEYAMRARDWRVV